MDRYVRVKKIGEGSFGKALLVKKKSDGKHYVIKEINISKMSPKERKASRKEVEVLEKLKHPNIVSHQDSFEENGNLYIVMDYCEGGDLYKRINSQRGMQFSEEQAMDWFVQICLAMKHVHDRKILHRDLKSQNIFLTKTGMIKLGDFGIARVLHSTVELARTCIGTPYYLSPEICENRPYNNKSDVWSLGCVLYELLTLKHAFEAGNMKNLVLKIIRGSYPPIPLKYSADVRILVAQLLKRNPRDRPSVNSILRKPFIQKRIEKFLSQEVIEDEFSHTVIHRKPLGVPGQRGIVAKPAKAIKPAKPKITEPSAKYGVSVAKKKPAVKKPGSNEGARKPAKPSGGEAARYGGARPLDARERRRREMAQQQDQAYQDYMKKVQQQRWERQQQEQMKRAREMGWKATLGAAASPDKENKPDPPVAAARPANQQDVVFKKPEPMQKYQGKPDNKDARENKPARPVSAHEHKAGKPVQPARPVSASNAYGAAPAPARPAWEAARQGEINRAMGGAASEQARIREEFFMRKREAALNKARGRQDFGNYGKDHWPPAAQPEAKVARSGDRARNDVDKDYLARLEAIRRQNFQERKAIQNKMAGIRDPAPARAKEEKLKGDPRYDPEARRKKIAALKVQAEERAVILRKQLEARKKAILQKLNEEGKQKVEQEKRREEHEKRPLPARAVVEKPLKDETPAAPPIGIETALKNIGVTTFFRSSSENDISKLNEEEQEHAPRKQWGVPFQPRMLPLEVTASAMEATSAADLVEKPGVSPGRKEWGQPQKTQIVSALGEATLQSACATTTIASKDERDAANKDNTPSTQAAGPGMGVTVTVTKAPTPPLMGVTVTRSPAKGGDQTPAPGQGGVMPSSKPAPSEGVKPEVDEAGDVEDIPTITPREPKEAAPRSPIKAWGEETKDNTANKGPGAVPKFPTSPEERKPPTADLRSSYDQFLKSAREKKKEEPLFEKVAVPQEKERAQEDDLEMEDVSLDELSFHTADGSLGKSSRGILLSSGSYDTDTERLRTCSLPDLRLLFRTIAPEWKPPVTEDPDEDEQDPDDEEEQEEGDEDEDDEDEDEELPVGSDDDDESNEYEHMLASMRDVLVSSARSPSPMKSAPGTVGSLDWDHSVDTSATPVDEEDSGGAERPESELSNLNEDWESDDDEDEEDGDAGDGKKEKRDRKASDDDESVFHRLEESRQMLEQELGIDRFLRVYKFLQAVQENEDDNADVGSAAEISDLLGEKEHLYPKILYLVIADSAYVEDNQ